MASPIVAFDSDEAPVSFANLLTAREVVGGMDFQARGIVDEEVIGEMENCNAEKGDSSKSESVYVCEELDCGYSCKRLGELVTHTRTHTGERPFACDESGCSYAATTSGSLSRQKRTHTEERPFACD